LLLVQVGSTLAMVGLIWFVQVVHYPLMAAVGEAGFAAYEAAHVRRTTWVVVPFMLLEAGSAAALLVVPTGVPWGEAALGAVLLAGVWGSTAFLQVPMHNRLEAGFDAPSHTRLVRTNALRTLLWTLRGGLVLVWVARALG
jgi:hypothetical protein